MAIGQIAASVGLSRTTTRFHLDHLIEQGLIQRARDQASGPGRPGYIYRALAPEANEPAAAYRMLAGLLASQIRDDRAVSAAGRSWAATLPLAALSKTADATATAMALLGESGFRPRLDGDWIALERCPFFELVNEHAEVVCGIHASLVAAALDGSGTPSLVELQVRPDGDLPCRMRIGAGGATWRLIT